MAASPCSVSAEGSEPRRPLAAAAEALSSGVVVIELPETVQPGESEVEVDVSGGSRLRVLVPCEARPRDRLVLAPRPDGEWGCSIVRSSPPQRQQVTALVPEGVEAGKAQLAVDIGGGEKLVVRVPDTALPGDVLIFSEATSSGEWHCRLERRRMAGDLGISKAGPPGPPNSGELLCTVPEGAVPGRTQLRLGAGQGGAPLIITVPAAALPGDQLGVTALEDGLCAVRVVKPSGHRLADGAGAPSGVRGPAKYSVTMTRMNGDPDQIYGSIVSAAVAAGAYISPKLTRGATPPLNIPGMVTRERLDVGEELVRMPSSVHLSIRRCREVLPRLSAAVDALGPATCGREAEALHAACVAVLLRAAEARSSSELQPALAAENGRAAAAPTASRGQPEVAEEEGGAHAAVLRLWGRYAEALLCESFDDHPYWRAMHEPEEVDSLLRPSREREYMSMMVGDVVAMYNCLANRVPPELLGPKFDLGIFLQARLSILTRVFQLNNDSCLVPINDFFNHSAAPGTNWQWDNEGEAMVLVASRPHEPGEELFISYGRRSNVLLFRTYGFTLPPEVEPAWTYIVQGSARPADVFAAHMLPEHARLTVHLETQLVQQSLAAALNACRDDGGDPEDFLRGLCKRCIEPYEHDDSLRPVLAALQRARAADPCSGAWWEHLEAGSAASGAAAGGWAEHALRVKMSEYLCLTAHLEILDVMAGRLTEEQCLGEAADIRRVLKEGLGILRSGGGFSLNTIDKGPVEA